MRKLRIEADIKVKVKDFKEIRRLLKEMGAKKISEEEETDIYFQHPCRNFRDTDEALRIRRTGERITLTYRGPRISSELKSRI